MSNGQIIVAYKIVQIQENCLNVATKYELIVC